MRAAAALGVLLAGCGGGLEPRGPISAHSESGALSVVVVTKPDPLQRGVNTAELELTGPDRAPLRGLQPSVTPWMPAHGHGSAVTPEVSELGGGRYAVSNLYLAMPGVWQLRIATGADEAAATLEVP